MSEAFDVAREAYYAAPGSEAEVEALRAWLGTCTTAEEAREVYDHTRDHSDIESETDARWTDLSRQEVEAAADLDQALKAFFDSPGDSDVEEDALRKWLSFCTTSEQLRELLENVHEGSDLEAEAKAKLAELEAAEK